MALLSRLLGHASDLTPEQTREELDGILLRRNLWRLPSRSFATFSYSPIDD